MTNLQAFTLGSATTASAILAGFYWTARRVLCADVILPFRLRDRGPQPNGERHAIVAVSEKTETGEA